MLKIWHHPQLGMFFVHLNVFKATTGGPKRYPDMSIDILNYLQHVHISIVKVYDYDVSLLILRFHCCLEYRNDPPPRVQDTTFYPWWWP